MTELESLIDPVTRGDAESPLRWTSKSARKLAIDLTERGKPISPQKVGQLLLSLGYHLNAVQRTLEGIDHPDRNEQFEFINDRVEAYQARNAPVISVGTRKKERIGDFRDSGWVNVSVDHAIPELAIALISRWWSQMGRKIYEKATELLIVVDVVASQGCQSRLFKTELQKFADCTGLTIGVSCCPPGTSKWNKIEYQMFCHITESWHNGPAVDREIVVQLIGAMRAATGPRVDTKLDRRTRPIDIGASANDAKLQEVNLIADDFYGDWNYAIVPRRAKT